MILVTIYYEDQRAVGSRGFGPHEFLVSCLLDEYPDADRVSLKRMLVDIPKKGDGKLIAALNDEAPRARCAGPIVAMLDHDKIRRPLGLAYHACKREVLDAMQARCGAQPSEIVLLEQNTETLIAETCRLLGCAIPERKKPEQRDLLLLRLSFGDRAARDQLRTAVPSFDRLVRRVADLIRSEM